MKTPANFLTYLKIPEFRSQWGTCTKRAGRVFDSAGDRSTRDARPTPDKLINSNQLYDAFYFNNLTTLEGITNLKLDGKTRLASSVRVLHTI